MQHRFCDWLSCPVCKEREGVSTLAHKTDIVIECYECGQISEYVIGEDISLNGLDIEAIAEATKEQVGNHISVESHPRK